MSVEIAEIVVETRRLPAWRDFLHAVTDGAARVGWPDGTGAPAGGCHALQLREGKTEDLVRLTLGWRDPAEWAAMLARLGGTAVAAMRPGALVAAMRPGALAAATALDPAGTPLELLLLPPRAEGPAPGWPVGHVALAHPRAEMLWGFYADRIGFRLNERLDAKVGPLAIAGGFLGSAQAHHTLAVMNVPGRRRLHHIMFGAPDVASVARLHDQALAAGVPMSLSLGQHPAPDGTTSFYALSPSGFDVEVGAGAGAFQAGDEPGRNETPSLWGHKPSLRMKLRLGSALVMEKLGL